MDLMNTLRVLLFCTSVLLESRVCHCARSSTMYVNQPVKNKSLMLATKSMNRKQVLLNVHGNYQFRANMEKHVFQDSHCFKCMDCMNRAIMASGGGKQITRRDTQLEQRLDAYNINRHNDINRFKRNTADGVKKEIEQGRAFLATVKKYTKNKKVYAIEVKTTTTSENGPGDTCHYYSVKKTLGCDDEHRPPRSKRTNKKTSQKMKKYSATTTETVKISSSVKSDYKKRRDVENSQGPESYMLSMEDFY